MTAQIQTEQIVHKGEARIALFFPYEAQLVAQVRPLSGVRWSRSRKCWHLPATEEAMGILTNRFADTIAWSESLKPSFRTELPPISFDKADIYPLLKSGTDLRLIQELLGHRDIKTTLRYIHVSQRTIQNIRSPLDTLFTEKYDQKREKGRYN